MDLGVSEYGILSAITTLSETQNDLGLNQQLPRCPELRYSADDITLFRQIALDLREFTLEDTLVGLVCVLNVGLLRTWTLFLKGGSFVWFI